MIMQNELLKIAKFIKENSLILLLALFVLADVFSYALIISQNQNKLSQKKIFIQKDSLENFNIKNVTKISDIKGPRIDEEAASIEKIAVKDNAICTVLPAKVWMFLLLAYATLLIFNLSYNFRQAAEIQWLWELALTFLALVAWYKFDDCKDNIWYPIFIIKYGILIYAIYLYFFSKKRNQLSLL
jgi:hypothetical protein